MRFEEAYDGWQDRRLTQEQAAQLLGVCERTFRRYIDRYEEAGMEGLMDNRISEVSMNQLGIQMIAAYSPEARGRSERFFRTLQDRLPKEPALANITTKEAANAFLRRTYLKRFNRRFMVTPAEPGSAFVPQLGVDIDNILCRQVERQ